MAQADIQAVAQKISQERGIPLAQACRLACRAAARVVTKTSGLGQTTAPAAPTASTPAPASASSDGGIVSEITAAGQNPQVMAAKNLYTTWSWTIPVVGLILSAKQKFSAWRDSKSDPVGSVQRGMSKK